MEKGQSTFCPKEILLVEIFVLKQLRSLFGGVYAFSVVGQLEYNPVVGNRSDDNVVVVDGFYILPVSVGIHEKEPLHTGLLRENFHT